MAFQVNHSGYDDRLFQITSQNDKVGNLKWWGFKVRKTSICFTVRPSAHWNEAGRSRGTSAVCVIVFSWCRGSPLQSWTILMTQLLFAVPCSCYSILSMVFLSSPHSWCLTALGIIVSWLLIIVFSLGVWFCSFHFLDFTLVITCWLTLCVKHSTVTREDTGPFVQSWPLLSGRVPHLGHLYCTEGYGFLKLLQPTSQGVWWDMLMRIMIIATTYWVLTVG